MPRFVKRASQKAGLPPGTLVLIGDQRDEKVHITLVDYNETRIEERPLEQVAEIHPLKQTPTVSWINVDGLYDLGLIETIGQDFGLHPLTQEDIVNTGQRPKMEEFDTYLYVVMKMLAYDPDSAEIRSEQLSLIIGETFLLSFQEKPGDGFEIIRERIRTAKGRIRKSGCDYLAYALIDAVVDQYFHILEVFGERIELLEEDLVSDPRPEMIQSLHDMKREMIFLRKQIWPMREFLGRLTKEESFLIKHSTGVFLRDVYDHTIQIMDTVESYRDILSGMLDIYLSTVSNKMNEIMKVLTIIATIFIPLSFVAGVYGMNFKYMPELEWHWGYFMAWGVMVAMAGGLVYFFRLKKWI